MQLSALWKSNRNQPTQHVHTVIFSALSNKISTQFLIQQSKSETKVRLENFGIQFRLVT